MTSKHLLYTTKGIIYDNNTCPCESFIHIEFVDSKKNIKNIDIHYQYKENDIKITLDKDVLSPCYYSIVNHAEINNAWMWKKLQYLNVDDAVFLYGFVSYITFFALLEQGNLMDIFPFTFEVPCTLHYGDCCDASMMRYLSVPMESILYNIPKLHYHFIYHVRKFIQQYADLFYAGPTITDEFMNKYTTESLGIDTSSYYEDNITNVSEEENTNNVVTEEENTSFSESCDNVSDNNYLTPMLDSMSCSDTNYNDIYYDDTYYNDTISETPIITYDNYDTIVKPLTFNISYPQLFMGNVSEQPVLYLQFG